VLWFYAHDDLETQIELRYDNRAGEYVLVIRWPGDHRQEERFATAVLFRERLIELQTQLAAGRWKRNGSVVILPDGWADKRPAH
jgi:hypothetical protein